MDRQTVPKEPSKLDGTISRLEKLCRKLKDEIRTPKPSGQDEAEIDSSQPSYFFHRQGLGGLELTGRNLDDFREVLFELHAAIPLGKDSISLRAVESKLQKAILQFLFPNDQDTHAGSDQTLTSAMSELRNELRQKPISWLIKFPVAGLDPSELPKKVGTIEFHNHTEVNPQPVSSGVPTLHATRWPHAHITVETVDREAAKETAIRELRRTFDLLNYFGGLVGNRDARVYLPWEARDYQLKFTVSESVEKYPQLFSHEWRGPFVNFSLTLLFDPSRATRSGFERALDILSKPNRSAMEDRVLTALLWAGRATVEERREEAFVLFTIALESLLVNSNDKEQLTQRFAIRGAHLIGRNFSARKKIYKDLKGLYALRSKIVHSGSVAIADSDRDMIAHYVKVAIHTALVSETFCKMERVEDFHAWFEDKTLGRDDEVLET
jgi:hypothetical protein